MVRVCLFKFWKLQKQLESYFEEIGIINDNHLNKTKTILKIKIILLLLLFQLFHFIYLMIAKLNTFYRIIHFDTMLFLGCAPQLNVVHASFCFQVIYFYYKNYWFNYKKEYSVLLLIYQIVFQNNNTFFFKKYFKLKNKLYLVNILVWKYTNAYLKIQKYFPAFVIAMFLFYQFKTVNYLKSYWSYFPSN